MNQIVLIGRLTRDPEVKTKEDSVYCYFSIAVDKNKDDVDFIDCVCTGAKAENLSKYTKKGSLIAVIGTLNTRVKELNTGSKVKQYNVYCNSIQYLATYDNRKNSSEDNKYDFNKVPGEVEENIYTGEIPF